MRAVWLMLIAVVLTASPVCGQKVAPEKLDKIVKDFAKDGFTLEHTYAPDFTAKNPNTISRFVPCYTGKTVMVVAVMAFKPQSLLFKVILGGKEAPKTHELENLSTGGESLYYDYRALKFGPKYVAKNLNCLNIVLYDKAGVDKPVYTLLFTKANK